MALTNAAVEEPSKPQALYNLYEGKIYARQLDQPVSTFLELLPPRTTQRSHIGEWIYIANPYGSKRPTAEEWARTRSTSAAILSGFVTRCAAIEASMDDMSKLSVIKKINRLRIKVKTAILDVADVHGCTDGKWMLFPMPEDVNQVWEIVARATAKGDLGTAAKVATDDGQGDRIARLICVYTEDFGDKKDVKRVLLKLKELGLIGRQTGISYKPGKRMLGLGPNAVYKKCSQAVDIFTYLEITGNNKWGLKPSLYQSKEALSWDV